MALLLLVGEALARAGGGHDYSGPSSGGGGGWSGGGGGIDGDGAGLLVWLVFEHPVIGVPVAVVVFGFVLWSKTHGVDQRRVVRTHARPAAAPNADARVLRTRDPNFSEPLFLDLARLVYARAHEERGRGNWAPLAPYFAPAVLDELRGIGTARVRDVVLGTTRIEGVAISGDTAQIAVLFEGNRTEGATTCFVRERWRFRRAAGTLSPGPDRMRVLACPNCGSSIETRPDGTCRNCDAVLADGRLQWQVVEARVLQAEPAPPLRRSRGGGVEVGTDLPLVLAPDLPAQLRAFQARHPETSWEELRGRFVEIFLRIQGAWSDGTWEKARPYETDFLFQQHRYWMERYAAEGLRNRMERVQVTDVAIAKVALDAWFESITVRVFARMRDWTDDARGEVVGGSRTQDRVFSEYWTFLRSAGTSAKPREQVDNCPSCGAPLDNVSESGVCGYCDARITGGEYDWVLSAIDQDEAYRG